MNKEIFRNHVDPERKIINVGTIIDQAANKWGDRTVLYHYETGERISYKEIAFMSNRVGNALRKLGIEIENKVAILLDDSPEWVYIFFGILKIGAIAIPLNPLLAEQDYIFFLNDSHTKVLFIGENYIKKIEKILPSLKYLKSIVICGENSFIGYDKRIMKWENFIKDVSDDLEIEPTLSSDIALFVYTSGTTGRSRAIMHTHRHCFLTVNYNKEVEGLGEDDIQFNIPKLYFLVSIGGLISCFDNGSKMILLSGRPTPIKILELISKYKPTILRGPPTIFARMIEAIKDIPNFIDLRSIRYIFCSGEALSPELFKRFKETFGIILYNNWGAQETGTAPISWRYGEEIPPEKIGSVGRHPIPGARVKIVDENENEVPDGVPGELMVQTETQFIGYWHEPKNTALKISKGWYKPGDFFVRDKDGYYWYLGRKDDMVKVGGRQIFPIEIENEIIKYPAVLECVVIPEMNEYGITEIHAYVVLKEGYNESFELADQIKNFIKERLATYKRPHKIIFVNDLPKTATGKIQRFQIKQYIKIKEKANDQH